MNAINMNKDEFHRWFEELMYPTLPYRSISKDYSVSKNVNTEICAECGGKCCKRCGCHFSPDDFQEISFNFLKKEIRLNFSKTLLRSYFCLIKSEINTEIVSSP